MKPAAPVGPSPSTGTLTPLFVASKLRGATRSWAGCDNATLVDHGTHRIGGLFDVSTATGNSAYANNLLADTYRPGNQNVASEILGSQLAKNFRANPDLADSLAWNPEVRAAALNYLGTGSRTPSRPIRLSST